MISVLTIGSLYCHDCLSLLSTERRGTAMYYLITLLYKVNCHFFPIILAWQFGLVWCDLFWGILPLSILLEQLKWLIHFSLDMCWYSLVWFKIGLVWLQDPLYHLNDGRQRSRNAFLATLQSVSGKCMKTSLPRLLLASLFKSWLRCTIGIWSYFKIISQIWTLWA